MNRLARTLAGPGVPVEPYLAVGLTFLTISIAPYYNVHLPGWGLPGGLLLLALGLLLATVLVGRVRWRAIRVPLPSCGARSFLWICALGLLSQVLVAIFTSPVPISDMGAYLDLADRLSSGLEYRDDSGRRAFWPPGFVFLLTPFVALFGATLTAITAANLLLYAVSAYSIWVIATRLYDLRVATIAVALFTLWPSRLLMSGLASKESLTLAMVLLGTALCIRAFHSPRRETALPTAAGVAFGFAALAQPGLLLLVAGVPFAFRSVLRQLGWKEFCYRTAFVVVGTLACVSPWALRNCLVFSGQFCGVATNGGSVFYRANNPLATGTYLPAGEIAISDRPELEENRVGFALGKQWIADNPGAAAQLSLRKLTHLLGSDDYGAYWAIFRGLGGNDSDSRLQVSAARKTVFWALALASLLYWVLIVALSCRALLDSRTEARLHGLMPLIYPLLYSACVYSIFESGSRQHIAATGPLMILAASALARFSGGGKDRNA